MLQELFRIPIINLPIYGFGLMMVLGLLAAMELSRFLARRHGLDPEIFANAGLLAIVSGVLGARLSHVLENLHEYTNPSLSAWDNLVNAANITSGGLTFYGGFGLAAVALIIYAVKKRLPLRKSMDIVAPCLMLGLALGRVGCFLNGCCYGAETDAPWAVRFPYQSYAYVDQVQQGKITPPPALTSDGDRLVSKSHLTPQQQQLVAHEHSLPVHPAQLYSTFNALILTGLLLAYLTLPHAPGRAFAWMVILYAISRFLLESLRVEPAVVTIGPWGLSFSMVLSLIALPIGIALWIYFGKIGRAPAPISA